MAEPVPTTDATPKPEMPGIKKLPPWAILGIVAAGVGIAILYKKSKEQKESFFQPTQAAQNRPYEPGFGASGSGGLGLPEEQKIGALSTTNSPTNSVESTPIVPQSGFPPGPEPVAPSPTTTETKNPGLTPNQINALNKGYPAVISSTAQPLSSPYPNATALVEYYYPQGWQQHAEAVRNASAYVPPAAPNYPVIPSPAQYPSAFATVEQAFPGGEAEHIRYVKEHSHYV